jgi:hypothetical protein
MGGQWARRQIIYKVIRQWRYFKKEENQLRIRGDSRQFQENGNCLVCYKSSHNFAYAMAASIHHCSDYSHVLFYVTMSTSFKTWYK